MSTPTASNESIDSFDAGYREAINLLKRRWPIALTILLMTILASSLATLSIEPKFQASVLIEYRSKDAQSAILGQLFQSVVDQPDRALATQAELISTTSILEKAIKTAGAELSPEVLADSVEVELGGQARTNLMTVNVVRTDPAEAAALANALAAAFISSSDQVAAADISRARSEVSTIQRDAQEDVLRLSELLDRQGQSATAQNRIRTRLNLANQLYSTLSEKHEQLRILEQMTTGSMRLAESASVPSVPVSPNPVKNLFAALLGGGILAILGVFALDRLNNRISGKDELIRLFTLPVLGEIPQSADLQLASHNLLASEAFRNLRTNIQFCDPDSEIRTLLVTSPQPSDGKTVVAANLAAIFAAAGHSVIVVDCDLRRPSLHKLFRMDNHAGVSTALISSTPPEEVVRETKIKKLRIMPSGLIPPNPSELLGSKRMMRLLDWLRSQADYVILDCPPVGIVTDAAVLSTRVDGLILVVAEGATRRDGTRRAISNLRHVGARLLGAVINKASISGDHYSYEAHHAGMDSAGKVLSRKEKRMAKRGSGRSLIPAEELHGESEEDDGDRAEDAELEADRV